jgi:hypothetical protein
MIFWAFCFAADMLAGDVDRAADPKNERVMLRNGVKIEEAMVAVLLLRLLLEEGRIRPFEGERQDTTRS